MQKMMKRGIAAGLLIALLVTLSAGVMVSCSGSSKLKKIEVEGYRENFFEGDEFETGADFTVWAIDRNGNRTAVQDGYTVKLEATADMNVAGNYLVTVEYEGCKAVYEITVSGADSVLQGLTVKEGSARTAFLLGEEVSFDGIRLIASYVDSKGREIEVTYSDTKKFEVSVTDETGAAVTGALSALGTYTVKIYSGAVSVSYTVTVEEADLNSIRGAVLAAQYGAQFVNAGTVDVTDTVESSLTTNYQFKKGDNYTYIRENLESQGASDRYPMEYHYSVDSDDGRLIAVKLENGVQVTMQPATPAVMGGVPLLLWWNTASTYGVEEAIANFWKIAANDPNGDYTETIDTAARTYSFSFGYLMQRTTGVSGDDYYFVSSVTFTLDEQYAVLSATLTQILYTHTDDYVKDDATGHVTAPASGQFSHKLTIAASQTVGERNAQNPYGKEQTEFRNFTLNYNGADLEDGATIKGNAGSTITIDITGITPESASFTSDRLYYSDGVEKANSVQFLCTGYVVYSDTDSKGNTFLSVTLSAGGEWDLVVSTKHVTKTVHLSVTGKAPTKMTTQIYRSAFRAFEDGNSLTAMIGSDILFRAIPNDYANGAYVATVTSANAANATLTETSVNGVSCYAFRATAAGVYTVTMTSTVAPTVSCTLVITVIAAPDLNTVLNRTYVATDNTGAVYTLTFTLDRNVTVGLGGTLTVLYQPQSGDAITQNMKFTVGENDLTVMLEMAENKDDALGIAVFFGSDGAFKLEDMYSNTYTLTEKN